MAQYDKDECLQINIARLKAKRTRLRRERANIKSGATVMSATLRARLDEINDEIANLSVAIHRISGEFQ